MALAPLEETLASTQAVSGEERTMTTRLKAASAARVGTSPSPRLRLRAASTAGLVCPDIAVTRRQGTAAEAPQRVPHLGAGR